MNTRLSSAGQIPIVFTYRIADRLTSRCRIHTTPSKRRLPDACLLPRTIGLKPESSSDFSGLPEAAGVDSKIIHSPIEAAYNSLTLSSPGKPVSAAACASVAAFARNSVLSCVAAFAALPGRRFSAHGRLMFCGATGNSDTTGKLGC